MIDTHAHIYVKQFDEDRDEVVRRAQESGVEKILLPNIDVDSFQSMMDLSEKYPGYCLPMAGLHPCDVKENYEEVLGQVEQWLEGDQQFIGVGETGIDLYWDKTFIEEQKIAFQRHLQWGKKYNLPVVVHIRDSFDEVFEVVEKEAGEGLHGVFHCFTGTVEQAHRAIDLGFKLGLGGVLTFKKSGLDATISQVDVEHLVIETDSPYLSPTPYRGKRNEPSYVVKVAEKLADVKNLSVQEVQEITTNNAKRIFNLS